jgi:hypothetical protein
VNERMINSAEDSSFTSTDGKRRDVPGEASAQKKEAAQHVVDIQNGLDALFKIILAEIDEEVVARHVASTTRKTPTMLSTLSISSIRIREAALKKKTAARIADIDGDSVASICLAATAAEDDADDIDPMYVVMSRRRPTRLNVLSVAQIVLCE